ncbi:MAG TPA: serine hydrolase [Thermoanaerobaculia bacterium]|jgi:CubicO group peptidase (beta-lactamase class C family)
MRIRQTSLLLVLFTLTTLTAAAAAPPDPKKALAGIDAYIEGALQDQKIPGAAVAVVVGDEVVLLKGYGWRDVANRKPVTPDTTFPIASITKQFTVASLGTLVRQGKLDWDKPVRDYMPDFRVHDDYATLRATTRDLVTHRIGLPRHDFAWFGSALSREELYRQLPHFPFSKDMRTRFQYNNFMFMTAGYLAGRLSGRSYEDHVRLSLLEPLGMTRTHFVLGNLAGDADAALGYELDNQRNIAPEEYESAEQMAPTGGLNSTARDLVRWVRMMLGGGELEGKRILQKSDVEAMMQPNMPISPSVFPEFGYDHYGMGLFVSTYRGYEVAEHGGNMPGAAATVTLLPREKIGIVVLTNRSGARLRDGLPWEIVDRLLGLPRSGMVEKYADLERKSFAGEEAAKTAGVSDRKPGTRPSHALEEYAGRYSGPGYGALDVTLRDGALHLTYNGFTARLDHWHYDVFQTPQDRTAILDASRVKFETDLEGEVSGVAVPMDSNVPPIVFAKQPPAEMSDPAFLRRFVGTYDLDGIPVEVVLREDNVLQWVRVGRARDLVPVRGTLFRIRELTGISVEFLPDASGAVDRVAVHSGSSTIAKRK